MGHRICRRREADDGAPRPPRASRDGPHDERQELSHAQTAAAGAERVTPTRPIQRPIAGEATAEDAVGTTIGRGTKGIASPSLTLTEGGDATNTRLWKSGNLAQTARFPLSHSRSPGFTTEENAEERIE